DLEIELLNLLARLRAIARIPFRRGLREVHVRRPHAGRGRRFGAGSSLAENRPGPRKAGQRQKPSPADLLAVIHRQASLLAVLLWRPGLHALLQPGEILIGVLVEVRLASGAAEVVASSLHIAVVRGFLVRGHDLIAYRAEKDFLLRGA